MSKQLRQKMSAITQRRMLIERQISLMRAQSSQELKNYTLFIFKNSNVSITNFD